MGGRACIREMRIPVSVIVSQIAYGAAFEGPVPEGEKSSIQSKSKSKIRRPHKQTFSSRAHLRLQAAEAITITLLGSDHAKSQ